VRDEEGGVVHVGSRCIHAAYLRAMEAAAKLAATAGILMQRPLRCSYRRSGERVRKTIAYGVAPVGGGEESA
jgi:hypothetical protein